MRIATTSPIDRSHIRDLGLVDRVVSSSMLLGLGLAVVAAFYFGARIGWAFGVSSLWGAVGLKLLQGFLTALTRPDGGGWLILLYGVLKFPVLYGIGAILLVVFKPNGLAVVAGVSLVLAVVVGQQLAQMRQSKELSQALAGVERTR